MSDSLLDSLIRLAQDEWVSDEQPSGEAVLRGADAVLDFLHMPEVTEALAARRQNVGTPELSDDALLALVRKHFVVGDRRTLVRTKWQDSIDIDLPSHALRAFAAELAQDQQRALAQANETVDKYAAAARVIALHLRQFCDEALPYDEMVAEASRRANAALTRVQKELQDETALRERFGRLLAAVAGGLKGEESPLQKHDWADLANVAAQTRQAADIGEELLRVEREATERAEGELEAVRGALAGVLEHCDASPEGETLFEEAVRHARALVHRQAEHKPSAY